MVRTRVGYCGGTKANPTYYSLGDHTEALQIDFDPEQISYEKLLDIFWRTHNPCAQPGSRQYMSAIFHQGDAQKALAERTRDAAAARHGEPVATLLLPLTQFYRAEDYHQKYSLRNHRALLREFQAMYADDQGLVDSTAAARINGFLAGYGKSAQLEQEIDSYGLTSGGQQALRSAAR